MEKEEIAKVLRRIDIVIEWYSNIREGYITITNAQAQELVENLDEVK